MSGNLAYTIDCKLVMQMAAEIASDMGSGVEPNLGWVGSYFPGMAEIHRKPPIDTF
jgi:hypothetical protein